MGKKRVVKKTGSEPNRKSKASPGKLSRKRLDGGILHVQSTYNNTRVSLTDKKGELVASSSSGALGFRGAKKGTPYAAAQVGDIVAEKAKLMGVEEVAVVVKGIGAGRESAIRSFVNKGIKLSSIKDRTPIPHNGPRARKPRRV